MGNGSGRSRPVRVFRQPSVSFNIGCFATVVCRASLPWRVWLYQRLTVAGVSAPRHEATVVLSLASRYVPAASRMTSAVRPSDRLRVISGPT